MPSSNIHLKVAYELNKRLNINSIDFIVGNIAPDAVNINGFAPREERWTAHLRDKDLDTWIENAKTFYKQNEGKIDNDFLLGYTSHLLTDVLHDKYLYMNQKEQILKDTKCNIEDAHDILREDMNNYSFKEFYEINDSLLEYENRYEILNIDKEKLNKWIRIVINIYRENKVSKYQKDEDIEFLIEQIENILKQLLKKEKIKYK